MILRNDILQAITVDIVTANGTLRVSALQLMGDFDPGQFTSASCSAKLCYSDDSGETYTRESPTMVGADDQSSLTYWLTLRIAALSFALDLAVHLINNPKENLA